MRVSKRLVSPTLEKELFSMFYQLIVDLKSPEEAEKVFKAILADTELTTVVKRLGIAYWLSKGRGVSNIKQNLAVAPATIETIKHQVEKSDGLKLAIKKAMADEWANRWAERIRKVIR